MAKKIYNFCNKMIVWLGVLLLATFAILALIEQAYVVLDGSEAVLFLDKGLRFWIFLVVGIVLIWIVARFMDKVPEWCFFAVGAILYTVLGTMLILNTQSTLRADAAYVYDFALNAKQGNFAALDVGGYFFRNPHQLGLALYEIAVSFLSEQISFYFFLNLLWIILIQFIQWRISGLLFADKPTVRKISVVMSFLFLPMLFYVLFLYGQIPGLLCVMVSFYFLIKYMRQEKWGHFLLSVGFGMLAVTLKQNYQISMLAMAILLFVKWLRKCYQWSGKRRDFFVKEIKHFVAGFVILIALSLPGPVLKAGFGLATGMEINDGVPNILYIDMGLQDDPNHPALGGWSNGYIWYRYEDCNFDNEVAFRRSLTSLHASAIRLCQSPDYFFKFFCEKIVSTWCEPLFGSVWAGPVEKIGYENRPGWVADIYSGEDIYFVLADACNVLVCLIYSGGAVFCVMRMRKKETEEKEEYLYPVLFMLGGFLCHVLWETKSQYVYPYVYLMIPVAALGIEQTCSRVYGLLKQNKR